jgi:hypothetical protein
MVTIEKVVSLVAVAIAKYDEMFYQYVNNPVIAIATTEPLKIIMACVPKLSPAQRQQLSDYLTSNINNLLDFKAKISYNLNNHQKHNLHLLLRASLKQQDPLEAMEQAGIEPELFADIFLRDEQNREVGEKELEKFSHLCHRVIQWRDDQLPEVTPSQTYRGKIDTLFEDLTGVTSPVFAQR